jgi:ATP phosphoribosyltransferase
LNFSDALLENNRSLTIESKCKRAKALLVRNGDVPVYVSYGQADLGIVGYDVLQESELKVAKLLDLGFGGCHMSLAVKNNSNYSKPTDLPANCKVASKFTKTARAYFDDLNIPVEIVHLTGSVELGPITGMAEAIIDLVATGKTLKENGLSKIDDLFYSTARLIANPLSLRLDSNPLRDVILSIESSKDILNI